MLATEDDFGKRLPRYSRKAPGRYPPVDLIGTSIADVCPEPDTQPHEHVLAKTHLDSTFHYPEPLTDRRLRRPICNSEGQAIDFQRPSSGRPKAAGIEQIDFVPLPQKHPQHSSKRSFAWSRFPTGYDNPVQWEDPPVPGVRPSHPVCANGVVALEQRRIFPAQQFQETGIPPPRLSKAPHNGSEWGGWGANGAPGRHPLIQPWDSLEPTNGGVQIEERFCDARTKRFPDMKFHNTFHLTQWHLDPQHHVDKCSSKKMHLNKATTSTANSAIGQSRLPAAGRPSGIPAEGCALPWYDDFRAAELAGRPFTTR